MKPLDPQDISFEYFRSSGPGGQNVNKVSTGVRLRFDLRNAALPETVKLRLTELAGKRLTKEGVLLIESSRFRNQARNQQQALQRLNALLQRAWKPPRQRKPTRPNRTAVQRRLKRKKQRGQLKHQRGTIKDWD